MLWKSLIKILSLAELGFVVPEKSSVRTHNLFFKSLQFLYRLNIMALGYTRPQVWKVFNECRPVAQTRFAGGSCSPGQLHPAVQRAPVMVSIKKRFRTANMRNVPSPELGSGASLSVRILAAVLEASISHCRCPIFSGRSVPGCVSFRASFPPVFFLVPGDVPTCQGALIFLHSFQLFSLLLFFNLSLLTCFLGLNSSSGSPYTLVFGS